MQNNQFIRYKTLDRCFRDVNGMYTKEDLMEACANAISRFHGDPDPKGARLRTIEKDIEDLTLRYGIKLRDDIRIGKKKVYKYEDTSFSLMKVLLEDGELEKQLLQNVLETLSLYDDVPQYKWLYMFLQQRANGINADETQAIEFQNNPDLMGMENFSTLLDAITRHQPVELNYRKYHGDPKSYKVHPYLLKQYNDRWFLIAKTEGFDNLSNYAIDRILEVKLIDISYRPVDIDLAEYFEDVVGVSRDERKEIENVIIRISKRRYPYIETKPLHSTQTPIRAMWDDEHCVIKLRVQVNNELEAKILSLGNDAEVLEPASLRDTIKQKIEDLIKIYNK